MSDDLASCPFCGGAAELDTMRGYRAMLGSAVVIYCTACDADMFCDPRETDEIRDDTVARLIAAWNRRTPAAPPTGLLVRELLEYVAAFTSEDGKKLAAVQLIKEAAERIAELESRPPAAPPPAPEGWRCVPVEPTDEMVMAGCTGYAESASSTHYGMITEAWHCILAASPSPPHAELAARLRRWADHYDMPGATPPLVHDLIEAATALGDGT